eukprot:GHVR01049638.1.p1 GENE.GHVR01049638.1~~GHVR01049638.1.p1  ORF type:complete len:163 (+),score=28.77 GHVR01049638.1:464-952(+)
MVIKTETCVYTECKIYPGKGVRYVAKDGKVSLFGIPKARRLFHQRIKPVLLRWTQGWRRHNKKGKAEEVTRKRTRKTYKVQKAIVGLSLDELKKKKDKKVEIREAAKTVAVKEAKAKQEKRAAAKKQAAPAKGAPVKGAPVKGQAKSQARPAKATGGKGKAR